jgi:putative ABC transport system ATP-binding protein
MAICQLDSVTKTYGHGELAVHALSDISLSIDTGEFTVFSGPSGSGKTTLLNLVGCLDVPSTGSVALEGVDVGSLSARKLAGLRGKRIGFIFQSFNLIPVLTALENVEIALQLAAWQGDRRAKAAKALTDVGLGEYLNRRPNQLSGGQQQRVAVARALVKDPSLIIADEPTANLDSGSGGAVLDLMRDMNERHGTTVLFSTHDPRVMSRAKRIITLEDGRMVEDREVVV